MKVLTGPQWSALFKKYVSMDREMSDNQRRFFCRILFLFFCCLPTGIVVYRAFHPQTPVFWQRSIQAQLGIETQIADIETPTPNETVLRGVTLLGTDGQPILSAIEARLRFEKDCSVISIKERVTLSARGLTELTDRLNKRLVRSGPWAVRLEDVVVVGEVLPNGIPQTVVLSPVEIQITPEHSGSGSPVDAIVTMGVDDFHHVAQSNVQCRFRCYGDPTRTTVDVETGDNDVPCWLVKGWVPELEELGPLATFQGRLGYDPSAQTLGRVKGRFSQVTLSEDTKFVEPISIPIHKANEIYGIDLDMAFNTNRLNPMADQTLQISAMLELPDGSSVRILPEYHLHQVLEVGSAINKTIRTARSRSVLNY